jgi:hypothetical protein
MMEDWQLLDEEDSRAFIFIFMCGADRKMGM